MNSSNREQAFFHTTGNPATPAWVRNVGRQQDLGGQASERHTREMKDIRSAACNGYLVDAINPAEGDPRQLRL